MTITRYDVPTLFLPPSIYAAADKAGLILRNDPRGGEWLDSVPRVRIETVVMEIPTDDNVNS